MRKRTWQLVALSGLAVICVAILIVIVHARTVTAPKGVNMQQDTTPLTLSSPAFRNGAVIPTKYTCKGDDISPPLEISNIPPDTVSLVLIVHDPDAPNGDFLHWTLWNINPSQPVITEGTAPTGAVEGRTDFGKSQYGGPCPPSGTHHYEFDLYALNTKLDLSAGASRQQLERAIQTYIIARTTLTGLVSA